MALRASFSLEDVRAKFELAQGLFRRTVIKKFSEIGEQCVNMSRASLNIDASAFPVAKSSNAKNEPKALKQRVLTKKEIAKKITPPTFGDYLDNTSNLRNSIGYFIAEDGVILKENGNSTAKGVAIEVINKNTSGFVLVVVAGMEYAAAVEAKGYNVITSSEKFAEGEIPKLIAQLKTQLERRR